MGTTSEKLTYLNGTKQLLKQKINNLGGSIDDNTTFRQYANQLQNVYDNLPKTEYQEGTEITLENCLKGKLDYENDIVGYGDTSQESTTGKNKFNITDYNSNVFLNNSATNIVKTTDSISFDCPARVTGIYIASATVPSVIADYDANKTYYISIDIESSVASRFYWGASNVQVTNLNAGSQRISITDKLTGSLVFYTLYENGTVHYKITKIMISEASDTTFEPYTNGPAPNPSYPFPIQCVTGNQDVVVSGKNKLKFKTDGSKTYMGIDITWDNSTLTLDGTSTNTSTYFAAGIDLEPLSLVGKYKISGYTRNDSIAQLYWKDKNGTIKYVELKNNPTITFNEGDTLSQIFFFAATNNIFTFNNETFNLQLEEGESVTPYEPYHTPITYPISLGDIELHKIGNYQDELVTDRSTGKWYKLKNIERTTLSNFAKLYTADFFGVTKQYGYLKFSNSKGMGNPSYRFYCNKVSSSNGVANDYSGYFNATNFIVIASDNDTLTTFNEKISGSDFCYVLATPTLTEITDTTLINQLENWYNAHSNNGTTIITSNGNLPMIIKVRALKGE